MTNEQLCLLARKGDPASLNALVEKAGAIIVMAPVFFISFV